MLYSQDRNQMRQYFIDIWQKRLADQPLEPMEKIIASVIELHPEYHKLLANKEATLSRDYSPEMGETNPFLHMGMHIAIEEQIATNRPMGVRALYDELLQKHKDPHAATHDMMDCLGEMLWLAQRDQVEPDEQNYLRCLTKKTQN